MIDIGGIIGGFTTVLHPAIFGYLVVGFFVGVFFGAVPGLTATLAIALLLPLTYGMAPVPALVMCMGVYMAGIYAGSITATTINIPGAPSAMMTQREGYPLMQRGKGAKALGHAAIASAIGGTVGGLVTLFIVGFATALILVIKTPDKFSLVLLALVIAAVIQRKDFAKGIFAVTLGLMIATMGMDRLTASARFYFGILPLLAGIDLISFIIGVFAISEVLIQAETFLKRTPPVAKLRRRDFIPRLSEFKEIGLRTYLKSMGIGYFMGVLPGAGGSMAALAAYSEAMRASKHPERYGKGEVQGIAAAESANNAMCGGAMLPMITFGIPGDPVAAVTMAVLLIHGLLPGPHLVLQQFHIIAPMLAALTLCAALLIIPSLLLLGQYYIKIASVNRPILYSFIAMVAVVGAYVATYDTFQMGMALLIGVLAYFMRKHNYPLVPLLLGFILGPIAELYLRRSLAISGGNPLIFFTHPASVLFLVLTVIFIYFLGVRPWLQSRKKVEGVIDSA